MLDRESHQQKDMPRLGVSIMDVVCNAGNYILWSDSTNNVHTASARMYVDLKVMREEFKLRRDAGLKIPTHAMFIEDKATDHRNWNRLFFCCLLVKNDIYRYISLIWMLTGHSHGRLDQVIGCLASATKALKHGLINEEELKKILHAVKHDVVDDRINIVEEIDEIPDLSAYMEKVFSLES